jgi:hypothetical protein
MDPASPCGLRRGKAQRCRGSPCRAVARRAKAGHPGYNHARVIAPCLVRPRARRSFLFLLPRGACGTTGRFTAPAAPALFWMRASRMPSVAHGRWSSSTPKIVELNLSLGRRSSPAFRTRMDFSACCITDRELSLMPTPPGPCELSHGHALGPSARRVGVNLLSAHRIPDFRP